MILTDTRRDDGGEGRNALAASPGQVIAGPGGGMSLVEARPVGAPAARRGGTRWLVVGVAVCCALVLAMSAARIVNTIDGALIEGDDFTPYWNGASAVAAGQTPYAWLDENRPLGLRDFHYPPILAVLLAPVPRLMDYPTARWGWLGFSILCLVASVLLIWRTSGLRLHDPTALAVAPAFALVPPLTLALGIGQLSPQLLLVMAGAYAALGARRDGLAGGLVALGAYLKTFPGLLAGYFLLRRDWRALAASVLGGLLLLTLTLLALGWEPHRTYLTRVVPTQSIWIGGPFNVSIAGVLTRLLIANPFTTPIVDSGRIGQAVIVVVTLLVLAVTASATWRAPAGRRGENTAFALVVTTSLLVSPINGNYNLIILILPLLAAAARVQEAWPRHLRWLLLAALLLGLPVEYYDIWPIDPMPWRIGWGNLLTSGPFFGLLTLWALMVRLCLERDEAR